MPGNIDELIAQMEADDLEEAMQEQTVATPRDYARSRGIAPQLVYYRIRRKDLTVFECQCGRKVIDIFEADKIWRPVKEVNNGDEGEVDDGEELQG